MEEGALEEGASEEGVEAVEGALVEEVLGRVDGGLAAVGL